MNLTTFDLVNTIIKKFKNEDIHYFKKSELEKQLEYFSKNRKYDSIFEQDIDLTETIGIFLMCGYLYSFSSNNDTFYIIKSDVNVNYNKLLEEALDEYCYMKKLCENYENLNFYITNPNNTYMIVEGKKENHNIKWTLETDGKVTERNIKLIKGKKHCYNSPFKEQEVWFDEADFNIVDVADATYVIRQQIINNEIDKSIIYSEIQNNKINEAIKIYCKK